MSDMRITFPMGIDATPLFDQIARQSASWRQAFDFRNVMSSQISRIRGMRAPDLPRLESTRVIGKNVNVVA